MCIRCTLYVMILNVFAAHCSPLNFDDFNPPKFITEKGKKYESINHSRNAKIGSKGFLDSLRFDEGSIGSYAGDEHEGQYQNEGGNKKTHFNNDGHYLIYNKGAKGKKGLQYEESGSYSKGHSSVGSHVIRKLDEYKKDTDFYDENHAQGRKVRYGGYHKEQNGKAGDFENDGQHNVGYLAGSFGGKGHFAKGSHFLDDAGHKFQIGNRKYHLGEESLGIRNDDEVLEKWLQSQ